MMSTLAATRCHRKRLRLLGGKPGCDPMVYKSEYEVGIVVPDHRPRSEELGLKVSLPTAGRR